MSNDFLVLKNVTKAFGKSVVIDDLDLTIKRGTMVTLLGPSGCGKTTILRLVAGLENPTSGQIFIDGEDVTKSSIQNRDICIVFQSYALFPHMSIGDNVGYGLRMQNVSKEERKQRVKEALELVDLAGFEDRYVDQISGGQQQRVALARALVLKPKVLLFDEPLSNLDANLRRAMREKIRELQQKLDNANRLKQTDVAREYQRQIDLQQQIYNRQRSKRAESAAQEQIRNQGSYGNSNAAQRLQQIGHPQVDIDPEKLNQILAQRDQAVAEKAVNGFMNSLQASLKRTT